MTANANRAVVDVRDREADAVDGDRALLDDVAQHRRRRRDLDQRGTVGERLAPGDGADAVDVALHEMAAEPVGEPQRALEVDRVAGGERPEGGAGEGLA